MPGKLMTMSEAQIRCKFGKSAARPLGVTNEVVQLSVPRLLLRVNVQSSSIRIFIFSYFHTYTYSDSYSYNITVFLMTYCQVHCLRLTYDKSKSVEMNFIRFSRNKSLNPTRIKVFSFVKYAVKQEMKKFLAREIRCLKN